MGFEEELEVRLSLAVAAGVRKTRSVSPLRSVGGMGAKGRRPWWVGRQFGEKLRMETL